MSPAVSKSKTILIVDDSATVAARVRRLLEAEGFRVFVESNPMFALQAVVRHSPQLVLLDVEMRSLSGGRVATLLGGNRRSEDATRIVYYSSLPEEELSNLAEETGVDGYIRKSSTNDELVAEVKALLHEPR